MARRVKKDDRWLSPYIYAWVFKYSNGMAYTSINGKRQATGYEFKASNKKAVMELLDNRVRGLANKVAEDYTAPETKSLYDAIIEFKKLHINKLTKGSIRNYHSAYKMIFTTNCAVNDKEAIKKMVESFVYNSNVMQNTKAMYFSKIHIFMNYCIEMKYLEALPYSKRLTPSKEKPRVLVFTHEEYVKIFRYVAKKRDRQFFYYLRIAQITGARLHEIMYLKWSDILNFDSPDAEILFHGKAGRDGEKKLRKFPINMIPYLKHVLIKLRALNLTNDDNIFKYRNTSTISFKFSNIIKIINEEIIKSKLSCNLIDNEKTFHTIRKTTATWYRDNLLSLDDRADLIGHTGEVEKSTYNTLKSADYYNKKYQNIGVLK